MNSWFGTSNASKNTLKNKNSMNASKNASANATRKNVAPLPQMGGKTVTVGSRTQVMNGTAAHTSGGLHKKDLMYNKNGRIVSRKAHAAGKKALKHLVNAGYKAKKGTFKLFSKKRGTRK